MNTYEVTVTRDGRWWMVAIPAINGLTQARRLGEAADMAREYIAASQNVNLDTIDVHVTVESVGEVADVAERVAKITETRNQATRLEHDALAQTSALALDLVAEGVPIRDVGMILGVSYQRIHQLVHESREAA
jgi:hypothetical protein